MRYELDGAMILLAHAAPLAWTAFRWTRTAPQTLVQQTKGGRHEVGQAALDLDYRRGSDQKNSYSTRRIRRLSLETEVTPNRYAAL